jgi:hypothetical protein
MANKEQIVTQTENAAVPPDQPKIKWNSENLKSSYCNICNATATREEVVMNFGINSNWDRAQPEMEIELTHRIVLSPFATKRLSEVLVNLVKEYESRYGELK